MKRVQHNVGFVSLNDDTIRVEAPYKERGPNGRKLRVKAGRPDEPEPTIWCIYRKETVTEKDRFGNDVERELFALKVDAFAGTRDEAEAKALSLFGGGLN